MLEELCLICRLVGPRALLNRIVFYDINMTLYVDETFNVILDQCRRYSNTYKHSTISK